MRKKENLYPPLLERRPPPISPPPKEGEDIGGGVEISFIGNNAVELHRYFVD